MVLGDAEQEREDALELIAALVDKVAAGVCGRHYEARRSSRDGETNTETCSRFK